MAFDWCVQHGQVVGAGLALVVALVLGLRGSFGRDDDMSWRYGRFSAPSDIDYDEPDVTERPRYQTAFGDDRQTVTCVACGTTYETAWDDRPPFRCVPCLTSRQDAAQRRWGAA